MLGIITWEEMLWNEKFEKMEIAKDVFDFGEDRYVKFGDLTDRGDHYMIPYYLAIGKKAKFNEDIGVITNIGEDDHDYWIELTTNEEKILCSPLDKWEIIA